MNTDDNRKTIEDLEEKNRLLLKIISLQDEVDRLNRQVKELTEQLKAKQNTEQSFTEDLPSEKADPQKPIRKKDTTKYLFQGSVYKKNRLVLAVIKNYAETHTNISAEELMQMFPKSLQGSLGTVRLLSDAQNSYAECEKRFFTEEQELIETSTGIVTVCSQWHASNIIDFIEYVKEKGIQIQVTE